MADIISKCFHRHFAALLIPALLMLAASPAYCAGGPVVIDAGHGGYDAGIVTASGKEKDVTIEIARLLKVAMEEADRPVWLTRKIDQYSCITERRSEAVAASPSMLLSLHFSESASAVIYITWYLKDDSRLTLEEYYSVSSAQRRHLYKSRALSRRLGSVLAEALGISVEYREMPLELLNAAAAPAVLVELPSVGFNYEERMAELVEAIARGMNE